MKSRKKLFVALSLLASVALLSTPLRAQEWTEAQKAVWKNVETYWALGAAQDLEGVMAYFHTDYLGWDVQNALPSDKASTKKWFEHQFNTTKTLVQEIKPVGIKIHGNIAIVHYYFSTVIKDAEGKEKSASGRWTDILIKQGDKWVLIGDHGGQTSGN
jgi:ketosteroid isomerase-like protein